MRFLILLPFCFMSGQAIAQNLFPLWGSLDSFSRDWYSSQLDAAGEKALSYPAEGAIFRFIWLRTFHKPIIVSVECADECAMHGVLLSGAGGYDPGKIELEGERKLTGAEAEELERLVHAFNPWRQQPPSNVFGMDGAQWILEFVEPDRYFAWDIWSPSGPDQQDYVNLALYLLSLSAFDVPEDDVY